MRRRPRTETRRPADGPGRGPGPGFTLVELMVVMVIIALLMAFILSAATDGIRRAEERGTQALITKIEAGLSDRVDAIIATRADANSAHGWLATVFSSTAGTINVNSRAQILARFDQIKAEIPDVFIVQNDTSYPLNFGAGPFPAACGAATSYVASPYANYLLPFGVGILNDPTAQVSAVNSYGANPGVTITAANKAVNGPVPPESTGIFGASYTAAAGVYKNLIAAAVNAGATPPSPPNVGYDGVDNDNNGLIDDLGENGPSVQSAVIKMLANHTHKTARSEMLYALLVEGQGQFGSTFSRDDFSDSEVKDTDGDGLPEFVDTWGEPLQFYRWPVFYTSDIVRGAAGYQTFESRQQNPLDPNQKLLDPLWWSGVPTSVFGANDSAPYSAVKAPLSASAFAFQTLFTTLTDPNANPSITATLNAQLWDRGSAWPARRAYYSRFLVLSGGPDKTPGVPVLDPAYFTALSEYTGPLPSSAMAYAFAGSSPVAIATNLDPSTDTNINSILHLRVESQAAPATFVRSDAVYYTFYDGTTAYPYFPTDVLTAGIKEAGNDDITSQNLQSPGGATQ